MNLFEEKIAERKGWCSCCGDEIPKGERFFFYREDTNSHVDYWFCSRSCGNETVLHEMYQQLNRKVDDLMMEAIKQEKRRTL